MVVCIGVIGILIFGFIIIDASTRQCTQYEDVCYKRVCTKGCYDKPTECSDTKVIGHKNMCIISKSIFYEHDYRKW